MRDPGDGIQRSALLSADDRYRYVLYRTWAPGQEDLWVMLNPSTADGAVDDPTIRRCMAFSRRWGAPGIEVVNLYALRSTNPKGLRYPDDVGIMNHQVMAGAAARAWRIIVAWGANRAATPAVVVEAVRALTAGGQTLWCLGRTKSGAPRHPLYVPAGTSLEVWR